MSKEKDENFRRRRLSVTDQVKDMSVSEGASPGGGRQRRLSLSPEMGAKPKVAELPFPLKTVGTFSCHGVEPGNRQGETHAKINQDRGGMNYPYGPNSDYALFMVFDGHGANGDKVSQFVVTNVSEKVEEHLKAGASEEVALTKSFLETDAKLKKEKTIDAELSGTTAVALLYKVLGGSKARVWSANCGDSRAVLQRAGKHVDLTEDQKPNTPAEQARITKAGGFVSPPEEEWGGPARVWLDANMTLPGLAMARSLGDHLVDRVGVIAEPVVQTFDIDTAKDTKIVMASDGVWEFIESDQALKILDKAHADSKKGKDATVEVTKLIETAAAKWRQEEGDYRDDITAICIYLAEMHEHHNAQAGSS